MNEAHRHCQCDNCSGIDCGQNDPDAWLAEKIKAEVPGKTTEPDQERAPEKETLPRCGVRGRHHQRLLRLPEETRLCRNPGDLSRAIRCHALHAMRREDTSLCNVWEDVGAMRDVQAEATMNIEPRGPWDDIIPTRIVTLDRNRAFMESQIARLKAETLVNLADRERLFRRAEELGITEDLEYRIVKTMVCAGSFQINVVRR